MVKKKEKGEKIYDVVILGAGPAGLTAAIYCARYGLNVVVLAKEIGGAINYTEMIENYPGFEGKGIELMQKFAEQAKKQGAEILFDELIRVEKTKKGRIFNIVAKKQNINAKSIILALGTQHKKLGIPGEAKFIGRGVSFCAVCDAPLYKKKIVAVIGGGNSAVDSALIIAEHSDKVYLIHRSKELKAEKIRIQRMEKNKKIEILPETVPFEIKGKDFVETLVIEQKGKKKEIKVDGIFVEIGSMPATTISKELDIKLDDRGYVITNENMGTNVPGIFAAGDIVKSKMKQVIISASQGALAAKSVYDYVNKQ